MIVFYNALSGEVVGYDNYRVGDIVSNDPYIDLSYSPLPFGDDPYDYYVDISSTPVLVKKPQADIDANLLLVSRNKALGVIRDRYASAMESIAYPYTKTEQMTWDQQEKEARDYLADPNAYVPMITHQAISRGFTVLDLANKIILKADMYSAAIGTLLGEQQALEDSIMSATTVLEIEGIVNA